MSTATHDVRFYALVGLFAFLSVSLIPNSANGSPSNVLNTAKKIAKSLPFLAQNKVSRSRNPFLRLPSQRRPSVAKSGHGRMKQLDDDVVFIIDDSGSIPLDQFNKGLSALTYFIEGSSPGSKFAAIKYSGKATLLFNFVSLNEAKKKLKNVPHAGGSTNTQEALKMARDLFLNPAASGHRQSASRVVVLVTDGNSNVQRDQTVPQANLLKIIGAKIIVFGVGSYGHSGKQELEKIATHPPNENLSELKTFFEFDRVANMVAKAPWLQG